MELLDLLVDPLLRQGVLGLCALQLALGAMLVRRLVALAEEVGRVVARNTDAFVRLERREAELQEILIGMRERLASLDSRRRSAWPGDHT